MQISDRDKFRKAITRPFAVTVGVTAEAILKGDPNRIAITFGSLPGQRYTIGLGEAVALDVGVTIHPATVPFTVTLWEHGEGVISQIFAIASLAGQIVCGWETILIH